MKINIKNINIKSICATLFLSLFLSCNNGIEELEKRNTFLSSLANLGNDFLDIFTSFGDSFGGVLGFNSETKKSEVGNYFKVVHDTVKGTKDNLNAIVEKMKREGNPNTAATEIAVKALNAKLDKIIEGSKTASDAIGDAGEPIANVAPGGDGDTKGDAGDVGKVDNLVGGIKSIVDVVLQGKGSATAGDDKAPVPDAGSAATSRTGSTNAGMLFANTNAGSKTDAPKVAKDAYKAVASVSGADILQAIKNGGNAVTLAKYSQSDGNGAKGKKDAEVAAGIALRAMTKGGKFANTNESSDTKIKVDVATEIKGAAVSAVTKALNTLTIAIRKTIDAGLKSVKDAMKINSSDTPVTIEAGIVQSTTK
ncbi:variable large family protein (plasmid) [Borrelia coriaceae]|uniref:Variable large protein n=1 Tax=Borrelia coriaceae ATCC 43381 TaxID=1408429 RepID=W5SXS5_9SPIR|nr:variable large family protein [Borrelia coriaceae]AHH11687.1 Variable outer membrane protein [Borrelia coriaceae ATCC 43381]UPA17179.1 variable large family protein [Borrelia coriaceae]